MRLALFLPLLMCASLGARAQIAVSSVPSVDIARYVGTWYEVASFPMFFQRRCRGDTTAEYTPKPNGALAVRNRCRTDSGFDEANGTAYVMPGTNNSQLKVSFFWPFKGDYWVIGLDADYRWAVVGDPKRKYLWVLSRTPRLPEDQYAAALATASAQGYDLAPLQRTPQAAP